mmetsp:Transcript_66162/g.141585  ORF Transcript_66162/g.141585 Transcript_66162/m.141585 type:complete len:346 (+) Transcript_66162:214-1251(+)
MALALLDALAGHEVIDVDHGVLGTCDNVTAAGRDLATSELEDAAAWWSLEATCRVWVVDVPKKDLTVKRAAHHLALPVLPLRKAGDVAALREVLHEWLVLLKVIGHYQLVLGPRMHEVRKRLVEKQVRDWFPVVIEVGEELARGTMPKAHGTVVAARDDEVGTLPHNTDALPVSVELPKQVAPPSLCRPRSEEAVIVAHKHLPIRGREDNAARGRLREGRGDGHVIGKVKEEDLPSVRCCAHHIAGGPEADIGDLASVRSGLKGRCEVRNEQPPELPVPRAHHQFRTIRARRDGGDPGFQDVLGHEVPVQVVALQRLHTAISSSDEDVSLKLTDTRHPIVAHRHG